MGKSSSITVGWKYFMGLHFAVCHGPVDKFKRLRGGQRTAWSGSVTANERISIEAPNLFGGKKREGGIEGEMDVMMGGPSQVANDYLIDKIGGLMPAFRGILSLVYRGGQISANNPYIKPFDFQVTRIIQGWNDDPTGCWYPEKAPILLACGGDADGLISSNVVDFDSNDAWLTPETSDSTFTLSDLKPEWRVVISYPDDGTYEAWSKWLGYVPSDMPMDGWYPDTTETHPLWTADYSVKRANGAISHHNTTAYLTEGEAFAAAQAAPVVELTGSTEYKIWLLDNYLANRGGLTLKIDVYGGELETMNPAHIIFQALTDAQWGMGYPRAQIDLPSFAECADTFFDEGLGLCLLWNQQSTIKDFIQEALDHAGAVYYADPKTGKFKLKALRNDYDSASLPIYNESNIIAVDNFQRPGYGETVNEITVVYKDQCAGKDASITVQDLANIQAQGALVSQTRQYPGIPVSTLAARIAERDLIAASTPLVRCRITVNRHAWSEVPGGVVKISWAKLGITEIVCRVLEVNYGTLTNGQLVIELAEDVFGLPSSSYSVDEPDGFEEPNVEPQIIEIQDVIEVPYWDIARTLMTADLAAVDADAAYVMAVASSDNGIELGFEMHSRISPADYTDTATTGSFAPTVVTTTAIARSDITIPYGSDINIVDVSIGDRAIMGSGRLAEFVEVLDIGGSDGLVVSRGILDTTPQIHASGTRIFFNQDDFAVDLTERATGETIDVKLLAFSGGGVVDIDSATPLSITVDQRFYRPYPPGKIRINTEAFPTIINEPLSVTYADRDRLSQTATYISQDENSIGPEAGTTYNGYLYDDDTDVLLLSEVGIANPWEPSLSGSYNLRLEIESVRGGVVSWQRQVREFQYTAEDGRLTEFSGARETEDNQVRQEE